MNNSINLKNVFGILFIIGGLLFNEFILSNFFSAYSIAELNKRFPLWLSASILIFSGLFLIIAKTDHTFFSKIRSNYNNFAIIFLNTIVLFVFVNLGLLAYFTIRDIFFYKNQISLKYSEPLDKLYPYLNSNEINELLKETWTRPFVFEPYTLFKERPFMGKYVNVSENGFRIVKNQCNWPPAKNHFNIFLFGGSTTFNYGISDEHAIASRIQELLRTSLKNKMICVYNFGRGNYFSSQERVLFEKLISNYYVPNLAIFIDGINDFYYYNDEPLYSDKLAHFVEKGGSIIFKMPLLRFLEELRNKRNCSDISQGTNEEKYNNPDLINKVINRYLANKKLIESAGKVFGVRTLFVWQPSSTYKYDLKYHRFAKGGFGKFTHSKFGYEKMANNKDKLGSNSLWLADIQKDKQKALYVDIDHYTSDFSKEIALHIVNYLVRNNLVK